MFNDDKVFVIDDLEIEIGYLNINGLLEADHADYLNNDKNLLNLDLLVLAETKLMQDTKNEDLQALLSNFDLYQRFDANDGEKHMGLLMISPKCSKLNNFDADLLRGFKDNNMDSQSFIYRIKTLL